MVRSITDFFSNVIVLFQGYWVLSRSDKVDLLHGCLLHTDASRRIYSCNDTR